MTSYQLQYFISACELNSFTKAADKHFVTQSAISQQIAAIEKELGAKLFVRSKHTIRMTRAGEIFYLSAKNIIKELENAAKLINLVENTAGRILNIGYTGRAEQIFLASALRKMHNTFPDVHVQLKKLELTSDALERVRSGELDGAFVLEERNFVPGIVLAPLLHFPVCCVVGPDDPLYSKDSLDPMDFMDRRVLRPTLDNESRKPIMVPDHVVSSNAELAQLHAFPSDISSTMDDIPTVLTMVEAGYGIALFSEHVKFAYKAANSNVRFIPIDGDPGNGQNLCFAIRPGCDDPTLSAFMDIVHQSLPDKYRIIGD